MVRLAQALAHSNHLTDAARAIAEETERTESPSTRLRLQVWNFMWCAFDAQEPNSAARSERLAALASEVAARADHPEQDSLAQQYLLALRAWDAVTRGESEQTAVHYADLALADGLSWTDQEWAFEVPLLASLIYMYADQPERAEALFAKGIAEFEEAGWRGAHLAFGHTILGYIRYRDGHLGEAEASARTGLDLANRVGQGIPVHWYAVGTLIEILIARGRTQEAAELAERYRFRAPYSAAVVFPDSAGRTRRTAVRHRGLRRSHPRTHRSRRPAGRPGDAQSRLVRMAADPGPGLRHAGQSGVGPGPGRGPAGPGGTVRHRLSRRHGAARGSRVRRDRRGQGRPAAQGRRPVRRLLRPVRAHPRRGGPGDGAARRGP